MQVVELTKAPIDDQAMHEPAPGAAKVPQLPGGIKWGAAVDADFLFSDNRHEREEQRARPGARMRPRRARVAFSAAIAE